MLIPLKLIRDQPLQQQLYEQLRELIASSLLAADTRMPSTRMLADQFSISRITVLLAYERLIADSYLRTEPAKGTFVSSGMAVGGLCNPQNPGSSVGDETIAERSVGRPDPRLFPVGRWRTLVRTALDHLGASLAEDHPDGDPALRQAIARWLSASRGIAVSSDQIILANGRQNALHIAAHLLLRPGTRTVIESPCDPRAESLIASAGGTVVRIPVDEDGIQTDQLPIGPAVLALVTPEHQRPTGAVMSLPRRHALLAWAARWGATVIEEDADGELRYGSTFVSPLMSLDREGLVIHAGDFAASLGPGMMLGYIAVPQRMIGAARAASRLIGDRAGRLEETALTNMLDSGGYARHLHHLRKIYLNRRDRLIDSLHRNFGNRLRIAGTTAGLHVAWTLPPNFGPAGAVAGLARRFGLDAGWVGDRVVLLGFGIPGEPQIDTGVSRLAAALAETEDVHPVPLARFRDGSDHIAVGN
jgi:GntR family transcriptional regulator/MocR family aminotransferase